MAQLSLALLGPMHVTLDGHPVSGFAYDKVRALLAYLVLEADRPHRRDALAGLLWPEQPDHRARNSLRGALTTLRQAIGDQQAQPPWLLINQEAVQCNPASDYRVDVADFTTLLAACQAHPHHRLDTCTPCARRLAQAVALYRGPLLAEFSLADSTAFEEWALLKREWLHHQALEALAALATYAERRDARAQAVRYARRQLELDPWREEAHRQVMRLLAATGQRSAALRQYARCRRTLADELGVQPAAETSALYAQIAAGAVVVPPVVRAPPLTLPVPSTAFVGRAPQHAEVAEQLTSCACRLLTLVGPPGIGKTRLALQVAADIGRDFADGARFVDLAPVRDATLVATTIAHALDIKETAGQSMLDSLMTGLRSKHLLLLLDNFEHLLAAAPLVAELVRAARDLTVLVTSRARLHLAGEHAFPVPPLALPDPQDISDLAQVSHTEAVALFLQAAQAAKPDVQLTPATSGTVVEICCRLEGVPLALELAAARITVLSPAQLLDRLSAPLSLLTGGARDRPARQQSVRTTIDWSYALLEPDEQVLFRRLGVFVGGCTLEAAEAIGVLDSERTKPVLDQLQALLNQSFLQQETERSGAWRFRMLETLREYAVERLEQSGEAPAARRRHARVFLELVEAAEPELRGGRRQEAWLARLELEHANLRAALRWAIAEDGADMGLRLAAALARFWVIRGYLGEGCAWLEAALAGSSNVPPRVRAKALWAAGFLTWSRGDATAGQTLEESLRLFREVGDPWGIAETLRHLGMVAEMSGNDSAAQEYYGEALRRFRELGDSWGIGWSLIYIGDVALNSRQGAAARAAVDEALTLFRAIGDQRGVAWSLTVVGMVAHEDGNDALARAQLEAALELFQTLGDRRGMARSFCYLGVVAYGQDDALRAQACYQKSLSLWRDQGNQDWIAACLEGLVMVGAARGQLERSARLGGAAEALQERIAAPLLPSTRVRYQHALAVARARSDAAQWAAAWAAGRVTGLDRIMQEALADDASAYTAAPTN